MGRMRRSRLEAFQKRHPDVPPPGAPLRALRYTSAGGRHADLRPDGWPVSALLKVGFSRPRDGTNPYSSKARALYRGPRRGFGAGGDHG